MSYYFYLFYINILNLVYLYAHLKEKFSAFSFHCNYAYFTVYVTSKNLDSWNICNQAVFLYKKRLVLQMEGFVVILYQASQHCSK